MFHSFSECDTVSAFAGKRNKNCMDYLEIVSEDNRAIQRTAVNSDTIGAENDAVTRR